MGKHISISERDFQLMIVRHLVNINGYIERKCDKGSKANYTEIDYNKKYAMDTKLVLRFIEKTQSDLFNELKKAYKADLEETIISTIDKQIKTKSLLKCIREGVEIKLNGEVKTIQLAYFKPSESLTEATNGSYVLYNNNILSVMQEVTHITIPKPERIDLVLFLNGLPIVSIELKTEFKGQPVQNAINQYKKERTSNATLFKNRCFVNFAVDTEDVYMCTKLKGKDSVFLPFNRGYDDTYSKIDSSEHLWKTVFTKDVLLTIIRHFIYGKFEFKNNRLIDVNYIFPRYHQLEALLKIQEDLFNRTDYVNYLIQHSAGSGKTNTISWLSNSLHFLKRNDKPIFDKVIVITDRKVVDKQLQEAIDEVANNLKFGNEEKDCKVETIDGRSRHLKEAIEDKSVKVIVSTIQKFKYITDNIDQLRDKTFAVIVDEAHSSMDGEYYEDVVITCSKDGTILDDLKELTNGHGKKDNISIFAFTATPKESTLNAFGTFNPMIGRKEPFHIYSMHQAIKEGYILDVLKNYKCCYLPYQYKLLTTSDPIVKTKETKRKLAMIEIEDEFVIRTKVRKMVDDFLANGIHLLNNKAKAMIITSSRQCAVTYKKCLDEYILELQQQKEVDGVLVEAQLNQNIYSLVAFTGEIDKKKESDYNIYKNKNISENQLKAIFRSNDDIKFLIVADKYQTGYDEPLLTFLYIDKKLSGIKAVQSISRINRTYDGKTDVYVMDFINSKADIMNSFRPFYVSTTLKGVIEVNNLDALRDNLLAYGKFNEKDVNDIIEYYLLSVEKGFDQETKTLKEEAKQLLMISCKEVVQQLYQLIDGDNLEPLKEVKRYMKEYLNTFMYLTKTEDISVENIKFYYFIDAIYPYFKIKIEKAEKTIIDEKSKEELKDCVVVECDGKVKEVISKKSETLLILDGELGFKGSKAGTVVEKVDRLSKIIDDLNLELGTEFSLKEKNYLMEMIEEFKANEEIRNKAKINSKSAFITSFEDDFRKYLIKNMRNDFFKYFLKKENEYFKMQIFSLVSEIIFNSSKEK